MIDTKLFFEYLNEININFFVGVPDSYLKDFSSYLIHNVESEKHIITANEGSAIGVAAGYYLSTCNIPIVYMQNSGLGNAINPLLSLASKAVYGIPMIIIIGWRGEPGLKDEPQHTMQGKIQEKLLEILELPYEILSSEDENNFKIKIKNLKKISISNKTPTVLLTRKNTFKKYKSIPTNKTIFNLKREEVLEKLLVNIPKRSIIVSNTGKTSREIYELREKLNQSHESDFLTVGSMGHCSQIALGISISINNKPLFCIDGDGSLLMHMGGMTNIGCSTNTNLKHILLNNGSHESVGGQPTLGGKVNFTEIAKGCNYKNIRSTRTFSENDLKWLLKSKGPLFIEIFIDNGSRHNLGRPVEKPNQTKQNFMNFLKK